MNEGDGTILSRETRKKKRGSGFRYSNKKDLERSKLKRAAKSRGSELASVTKALSYPRAQSSGGVSRSGGPFCLEGVKKQDGDQKDLSQSNSIVEGECPLQVSTF
jgi:DNA-binding transcriptional MerR regulator